MNIFHLDTTPQLNARSHADKHVLKMGSELTQMFASRDHGGRILNLDGEPSKGGFPHHPCTVWLHYSKANWSYGLQLLHSLIQQCKLRGYKTDDLQNKFEQISSLPAEFRPSQGTQQSGLTEIPLAMPDWLFTRDDSPLAALVADGSIALHGQDDAIRPYTKGTFVARTLETAVLAYRAYYIHCKVGPSIRRATDEEGKPYPHEAQSGGARWRHCEPPAWWPGNREPFFVYPEGKLFCSIAKRYDWTLHYAELLQEREEEHCMTNTAELLKQLTPIAKSTSRKASPEVQAVIDQLREIGSAPSKKADIGKWLKGKEGQPLQYWVRRHVAWWVSNQPDKCVDLAKAKAWLEAN